MTNTKTVTEDNFQIDVLGSDKPVLVDFWATWCGPCKMVTPILEDIAAEHDEFTVAKVDADENAGLLTKYEVRSIPTLILFKNGEPVQRIVGAKPKAAILAEIADYV